MQLTLFLLAALATVALSEHTFESRQLPDLSGLPVTSLFRRKHPGQGHVKKDKPKNSHQKNDNYKKGHQNKPVVTKASLPSVPSAVPSALPAEAPSRRFANEFDWFKYDKIRKVKNGGDGSSESKNDENQSGEGDVRDATETVRRFPPPFGSFGGFNPTGDFEGFPPIEGTPAKEKVPDFFYQRAQPNSDHEGDVRDATLTVRQFPFDIFGALSDKRGIPGFVANNKLPAVTSDKIPPVAYKPAPPQRYAGNPKTSFGKWKKASRKFGEENRSPVNKQTRQSILDGLFSRNANSIDFDSNPQLRELIEKVAINLEKEFQ